MIPNIPPYIIFSIHLMKSPNSKTISRYDQWLNLSAENPILTLLHYHRDQSSKTDKNKECTTVEYSQETLNRMPCH